ncbi:MAG: hypothetical protein IKQ46_04960 [Bacteroidales bacterium]|jgi:hypothetical protein|nr:hypothetical protein [Bacteroidales bacterium]
MRLIIAILFAISCYSDVSAQYNLLGNDYNHIFSKFNEDPEFYVKVDTVNKSTIVITCKTSAVYPYYTYEIDLENDECVSFGTVSKDRQVYETYVDMLSTVGTLIVTDKTKTNFTYCVTTNTNEKLYYTIKQPFINSDYLSRRSIFYVLVTRDNKKGQEEPQ